MDNIIMFFENNYQWIFSGIGTSILSFIIGYIVGYKKATKFNQKIGNKSTGIQVGRDYKNNSL